MKKNIAVIGCGYWGQNLIRNFYELGCLHSVCDSDQDSAQKFANLYKVDNLPFNHILSDPSVNGVAIAVPAILHASMAIKAMKAKKNVFVEKPIALNEIEAKEMISSAKDNNVELMVGHLLQYHPIFTTIKKYVHDKRLGSIKYIRSNRLSLGKIRSEEDVIWSFAPHDISMILGLASENFISIDVSSANILRSNIADCANLNLKFKSGLIADISVSWIHPFKEHKLTIIGSKGMIVFDDTLEWNKKFALYEHKLKFDGNFVDIQKSDPKYIEVEEAEPLKQECKHFNDVASGLASPITDGIEGLNVLKILEKASSSALKNM
tara:strand:+ start:101 stop:1066 length:966 start_codon:yes stop_codon:yes gene_type:complete